MQEFDLWFDEVIKRGNEPEAEYWLRVRNALKAKYRESYKNGVADAKKEVSRAS